MGGGDRRGGGRNAVAGGRELIRANADQPLKSSTWKWIAASVIAAALAGAAVPPGLARSLDRLVDVPRAAAASSQLLFELPREPLRRDGVEDGIERGIGGDQSTRETPFRVIAAAQRPRRARIRVTAGSVRRRFRVRWGVLADGRSWFTRQSRWRPHLGLLRGRDRVRGRGLGFRRGLRSRTAPRVAQCSGAASASTGG